MNSFDVVLIIIIAIFTIRGLSRGLITELIILISLIAGTLLAFHYFETGAIILQSYFPLLPASASRIMSFIVIFLIVNIILRIAGKILNRFARLVYLQNINRLAGGAFALLKISLILSVLFFLISLVPFSSVVLHALNADKSILYKPLLNLAPKLAALLGVMLPTKLSVPTRILPRVSVPDSTAIKILRSYH